MSGSFAEMKMGLRACLLLLSICWFTQGEETQILLVGAKPDHPYATHMYQFECALLAKCLNKHDGIQAEAVPEWPPTDAQLSQADAVVFYSSPAGAALLKDPFREQFSRLMSGKAGLVAIHWGTGVGYDRVSASQAHRELFLGWLGGWFRRPPCGIQVGKSMLEVPDSQHPITRGWQPWEIRDEFYLNPVLHERAQPLLRVEVNEAKNVVGWTFERQGGGRSIGITLGHFHHNFAREDFRRLLVNSILWSAQVEIPRQGANVAVEPDATELPPKE